MKKIQLKHYSFSRYSLAELAGRMAGYYRAYYDPREGAPFQTGQGNTALTLVQRQDFHLTESNYLLFRQAKLYEYASNEYLFLYAAPHLTLAAAQAAVEHAYTEGMAQFTPAPGHKCTVISAVILCDTCDADAAKYLRRVRRYKSFHLSFYGWMNLHTALLVREGDRILTNEAGRDKAKVIKNIFRVSKAQAPACRQGK